MEGSGKRFMESTRYMNLGQSGQQKGQPQPPLERPAGPEGALIPLPDAAGLGLGGERLIDVIGRRRSLRAYGEGKLTLRELAFLLWCCQGVQQTFPKHTLRTVPSAGARHAFETYVLANRVEGLAPGLYRYAALKAALIPESLAEDIAERITAGCLGQGMVAASAATIVWAAELERMYYRYGERGYRYLHLDAGHACQNLYLAAEAVGCGACAIAAFSDEALNEALGLDGENRFAVYAAAVGKKPE